MKLSLDLLRKLLLYIEENTNNTEHIYIKDSVVDGYTKNEIFYHLKLLSDGEYILGEFVGLSEEKFRCHRLTLKGHQYLENIREKYIWETVQKELELKGFKNVSLDILKDYVDKLIRKKLGI